MKKKTRGRESKRCLRRAASGSAGELCWIPIDMIDKQCETGYES